MQALFQGKLKTPTFPLETPTSFPPTQLVPVSPKGKFGVCSGLRQTNKNP